MQKSLLLAQTEPVCVCARACMCWRETRDSGRKLVVQPHDHNHLMLYQLEVRASTTDTTGQLLQCNST